MHRFFILWMICISVFTNGFSQSKSAIIPTPISVIEKDGNFIMNNETIVYYDSASINTKNFLLPFLQQHYKIKLKSKWHNGNQTQLNAISNAIILHQNSSEKETYFLNVDKNKITIEGSEAGVFYGMQTLIQLLPTNLSSLKIPCLTIFDAPRFGYRGLHLDVSRHFFPVTFIKRYIDFLALHKLNTFHWHLTDDQGWRIEIKKYPLLTKIGSSRNQTLIGPYGSNKYDGKKYGGFYTQTEIKEVIQYAAERYINIIPEIEMPGHSQAALASYPFLGCTKGPYNVLETWGVAEDALCAGNDSTYQFYENVLNEIIDIFPSQFIHIGGDECAKTRWKACKDCQNKMKQNNLKDEHELQGYFIKRMEKYINQKGKKIIGWDEIMEGGLAPNAAVMSWRGEEGGIAAAKQQHDVVMTPGKPLYFDHTQSINEDSVTQGGLNTLKDVYNYNPIPESLILHETPYILGAQANMWTEYMDNEKKVEYMLFPRIASLSEVLWTKLDNKNYAKFEEKIPTIFGKYDLWKINYSRAYFDVESQVINNDSGKIFWSVMSKNKLGKIYCSTPNQNEKQINGAVAIAKSGTYKAILKDEKNNPLSNEISQTFFINKATGKPISLSVPPNKSYAGNGAQSLVDGIQNKMGMPKSAQFLGFWGDDVDIIIDLKEEMNVDSILLHSFEQKASWIYRPKEVTFSLSNDGVSYTQTSEKPQISGISNLIYSKKMASKARYIKISIKNIGLIPENNPGASNKAWIFLDEVEVK
jgi:hexosaminidase